MRSLFHKHNSLPLGQIQALVSFYCWVQWLNWTKLTDKSDIRWTNEVWLQSYLKHRSLVLKTNCAYTIQAKKKFYCIDPWSQLLSGRCSRYILHLGRHQFVPLTLSSYLWMKVWILKAEYTNLRRGSIIVLLTSWFFCLDSDALFFKMGHSRPLFLYFRLFNTQLTVYKCSICKFFLPMTGFEPRTSCIGSNRSTNWATTTAHSDMLNWDQLYLFGWIQTSQTGGQAYSNTSPRRWVFSAEGIFLPCAWSP